MSADPADAGVGTVEPPEDLLLDVQGLTVAYRDFTRRKVVRIVDDVSFQLRRGEALGLAGESGCGKTTCALALMGLLPRGLRRTRGEIYLHSNRGVMRIHRRTERGMRDLRWRTVSLVFQGASNALDPVMRVSEQIAEAIRLHEPEVDGAGIEERIGELFGYVGISPARARQYPHEFSGGMRQRVMIALALACRPELIVGDEPTTGLDVMMQAQILELLEELRRELGLAMILITHDLSVLAETCERVAIMYAGQIAEQGPVETLFRSPQHPYTQRLLSSFPAVGGPRELTAPIPGIPPDPADPPPGCRFEPRCHLARERCALEEVEMRRLDHGQEARCLFAPWPGAGLRTPPSLPVVPAMEPIDPRPEP
jgi:peptide/nickel transport system ATP-binding protein